MLRIKHLWIQKSAWTSETARQAREKWPDAEQIPVDSHWNIPELHGNPELVKQWMRVKQEHLVIGNKAKFTFKPNGRSTDFIGPQVSNGCLGGCAYCYVARQKGHANPITTFANYDAAIRATEKHYSKLDQKSPNQTHPEWWTYDIGCNNDVSVDAIVNPGVEEIIRWFSKQPTAMASFATKFVNMSMLDYEPRGHTRIRFSLMPEHVRKVLDVGTATTSAKIQAANEFRKAGYEVHFNLSPIVVPATNLTDWGNVLDEMNDVLDDETKLQAKAELIFLTHNAKLHQHNLQWHPKAEELLWTPDTQEIKTSSNNAKNLRYKWQRKQAWISEITQVIETHAPWLDIRYAF